MGQMASEILQDGVPVVVRGRTSQGIFLEAGPEGVIFVTQSTYRGPLTVNLLPENDFIKLAGENDQGYVGDSCLELHPTALGLNWSRIDFWKLKNEVVAFDNILATRINYNIQVLLNEIVARRNDQNDYLNFISPRLHTENTVQGTILAIAIPQVLAALWKNDLPLFSGAARKIIGLGRGLTPSGDDFLSGVFYALHRIASPAAPYLNTFDDTLLQIARARTTRISANLIQCSLRGQVDERLNAAFDTLLSLTPIDPVVLTGILNWGSSSGVDWTCGVICALRLLIKHI